MKATTLRVRVGPSSFARVKKDEATIKGWLEGKGKPKISQHCRRPCRERDVERDMPARDLANIRANHTKATFPPVVTE